MPHRDSEPCVKKKVLKEEEKCVAIFLDGSKSARVKILNHILRGFTDSERDQIREVLCKYDFRIFSVKDT